MVACFLSPACSKSLVTFQVSFCTSIEVDTFKAIDEKRRASKASSLRKPRRGAEAELNIFISQSIHFVQVSWSGVPNPTVADVIALYVPSNANITDLVPAKYQWANQSPGYLSGSGSLV